MTELSRRDLLLAGGAGVALAAGLSCNRSKDPAKTSFDLEEPTLDSLQMALRQRRLSSRELTEAYRERIEANNTRGPELRAVIRVNPYAVEEAAELDRERDQGTVRGPLHGIPVLLKDNIATAGPMPTTAGSLLLTDWVAERNAPLVEHLRAAGAVILGKTNLSEWANIRSPHSISGWSAVGGFCRNPYALDRSPSGSSSGSAVAVSTDLCALAVGTETNGSIVCPAALNGVVGIKPTVGAVSRSGIIPISHSQDTPGPLARTVADAAKLLSGMAGDDPDDPVNQNHFAAAQWTLQPNGLQGVRLGVARRFCMPHPKVTEVLEESLTLMESLGAEIVDPVEIPGEPAGEYSLELLLYELKADLAAFFAGFGRGAPITSVTDIVEGNRARGVDELAWFGQEWLEQAQEKGPLSDERYQRILSITQERARRGLSSALRGLQALVCTTAPPAWLVDRPLGDLAFTSGCRCPEWASTYPAVAGYPHITVPAGFAHGLPVGLSFIGRAWSEPRLFNFAYAFEHGRGPRVPPGLPTTTALAAPTADSSSA